MPSNPGSGEKLHISTEKIRSSHRDDKIVALLLQFTVSLCTWQLIMIAAN